MEAVVRASLTDAFPDTTPTSLTPTRSGNNKHTVAATLADGRHVVVQYRDLDYGSLEPEAHVTRLVGNRTEVPVPTVLATGAVRGYSYVVTRLVPGTNLHTEFETLPLDTRETIARRLGRYLGIIHETFSFDGYGAIDATNDDLHVTDRCTDWRDWLHAYTDAGLDAFTEPLTDLIDPIHTTIEDNVAALPPTPTASFYPWDYRPGNALISSVDATEVAAVLDWGDPLAAHRELALAKSEYLIADWYADPEDAAPLRDAYHDGYRTATTIPPSYFDTRRRIYRLVAITRSAYDSQGKITRQRYPTLDPPDAAAFHRQHIEPLLDA